MKSVSSSLKSNEYSTVCENGTFKKKEKQQIELICMDDVEEEETKWLYYPYVPQGKMTLCASYPGVGKTYLLCYMAACVSNGKSFMNIVPFESEPQKVIYFTSEDGLGDTLKKRLRICGANMKNIFSIERKSDISFDDYRLGELFNQVKPKLVIFDPIQSYIGNIQMNAANETREKLDYIVGLAEKYDTAIVIICHFNKNQKGDAITRIIGSTDIVGASRSYLALGNVPGEDIKFMSHEKSSLAKSGETILFDIDTENGGIVVKGKSDKTMDDYTRMSYEVNKKSSPILDEVKKFLISNMPDGKRPANEIKVIATANHISEKTLERAKDALGIKSEKESFTGKWIWTLPKDINNMTILD